MGGLPREFSPCPDGGCILKGMHMTDIAAPRSTPIAAPSRLPGLAALTLAYNILVILWGAVVRATGSGAGCGSHWPKCDGAVVPAFQSLAQKIEYSHRLTSGLCLVFVGALVVVCFRESRGWEAAPRSFLRRASLWSLAFVLMEALIGAAIVLLDLVAHNVSLRRAASGGFHLVNTFFLVGALTCVVFGSRPGAVSARGALQKVRPGIVVLAAALLLWPIGSSGAVAALGDTLFPSTTLAAGLAADLSPTANVLLKLRSLHPFFAILCGFGIFVLARAVKRSPIQRVSRAGWAVQGLVLIQWGVGLLNLFMLAPLFMQLLHLVLADVLVCAVTWMGAVWLYEADLSSAPNEHIHEGPAAEE